MSVVRAIVFPALRLLLWAVIAVALVVLAFRGGTGDPGPGGQGAPTLDLDAPTVPVSRGTAADTVSVTGTVVADDIVPIKATAGTVRRVLVAQGATVPAGQALLRSVSRRRSPPWPAPMPTANRRRPPGRRGCARPRSPLRPPARWPASTSPSIRSWPSVVNGRS